MNKRFILGCRNQIPIGRMKKAQVVLTWVLTSKDLTRSQATSFWARWELSQKLTAKSKAIKTHTSVPTVRGSPDVKKPSKFGSIIATSRMRNARSVFIERKPQ
ncbi:MAG: hypothetical protein V7756_16980 [Halopseudomonas sp.]|uniref:hypothetical protein n=1 Tax=Halopseudomonas sp. TaxID=2901191 RepID=UPI003002AB3C